MSEFSMCIDNLGNLKEFHNEFDIKVLELKKGYALLEPLLAYKKKTESDEEVQQLQWEVEANLFTILRGKLFAFSTSNGKEIGELIEYPELNNHQASAFAYLEQRATESRSAYLRAKYNLVLWHSILKKNNLYAEKAAKNYIISIHECVQNSTIDSDYSNLIIEHIENLYSIVNECNLQIIETKNTTSQLLTSVEISLDTKHHIVENMLNYPKVFKAIDFKDTLSIYTAYLQDSLDNKDDYFLVDYYLPIAVRVSIKTNNDAKQWYDEIGQRNLKIATRETTEDRFWLKLNFYTAAIEAFRLSGNIEQKREVEQLYFELKPKVVLNEYQYHFDEETKAKLKENNQQIKAFMLSLLDHPPEYFYSKVATGGYFTKIGQIEKVISSRKSDFSDFFSTLFFDNNKNISKVNSENTEYDKVLKEYGYNMKEKLLPLFHYYFVNGIKSGKITAKNFITYLVTSTWIGKSNTTKDLGGNLVEVNWVYQLAPSIAEFFNQILAWGESKYYSPSFILCIDSMTLKIEGLFRNFSERVNVSTSKGKRNGVEEVLIHDILHNEVIQKYFDEDDMLLFNYVFSKNGGLNLRNNIAHCFYSENEYSPDLMFLLLAVLLRIGKYDLTARKLD